MKHKHTKFETEGYVYFILSEDSKRCKIGFATDIRKRMKAYETTNPYPVKLIGYVNGTMQDEQDIHKKFEYKKVKLEWFTYDLELKNYVKKTLKKGLGKKSLWNTLKKMLFL